MNLDQALQTFVAESRELLDDMETAMLNVDTGSHAALSAETINGLFRAAHTIKGSAGLFGLDEIVSFTHVVEGALDRVREGSLVLTEPLIALLLECLDHMRRMVNEIGVPRGIPATDPGNDLIEQLRLHLKHSLAQNLDRTQGSDHWHISFRCGADLLRHGMDPLSILRYLGTLGTIKHISTLPDALPALADLDPESCYLGFEIAFDSQAGLAIIENAFEFVRDDCSLHIVVPHSPIADYLALVEQSGNASGRTGEALVSWGSLTRQELDAAQRARTQIPDASTIRPPPLDDRIPRENRSIRVDARKLDQLIDLVGELITSADSAQLAARQARHTELQAVTAHLADLVEQVRGSALQLRMVKIGDTFNRFRRVVHDVSHELGKDIVLHIAGEHTELDKTVVDKIGDPLTHLVRNAIDHGIESVDARIAAGKPAQGNVSLNAYHDAGSIVIEVSDDGGGLNRDKILAKAMERGLVAAGGAAPSDQEIFDLIFEPGFSTADQLSNLSGRGVGMDVVRRDIAAMRGHLSIASQHGIGTRITVRLPLTLAIIDGFHVGVGDTVFVVPLDAVDECVAFSPDARADQDYTDLRGKVLPLIRLREHFGIGSPAATRQNLVVVSAAGHRCGLVVDALLGGAQTVIKPLSTLFSAAKGIAGSSVLGNGEVALILDVGTLTHNAIQAHSHTW